METSPGVKKSVLKRIGMSCVNFNIKRLSREVSLQYDRALSPLGIRGTQYSLLITAAYYENPSMNEAAAALGMDRTTLTKNLKPMFEKGFLSLESGSDRRQKKLSITDAGRDLLERAIPLWEKVQNDVINQIGKQELKSLLRISAAMESSDRSGVR